MDAWCDDNGRKLDGTKFAMYSRCCWSWDASHGETAKKRLPGDSRKDNDHDNKEAATSLFSAPVSLFRAASLQREAAYQTLGWEQMWNASSLSTFVHYSRRRA